MKTFFSIFFLLVYLSCSAQKFLDNEKILGYTCPFGYKKTIFILKKELQKKNIKIFSEIDHSNEAEKVGLALPKIKLFIVGNPKVGTMLMQENQDIALHLPLKILVKENTNGKTEILYQKIQILAIENGLEKSLPIAKKIDEGIENLLESVVSKGEQ